MIKWVKRNKKIGKTGTSDGQIADKTDKNANLGNCTNADISTKIVPSLTKSEVLLDIQGLNQVRVLNTLAKNKIPLRSVKKESNKNLIITIKKNHYSAVVKLLSDIRCKTVKRQEKSRLSLYKKLLSHGGLVVGFLLFFCIALVFSARIWRIEISGNETIETAKIVALLSEGGIGVGKSTRRIDLKDALDIVRDIGGVAEGTVLIRGSTLKIEIIEDRWQNLPPPNLEPAPILSNFDATVSRIVNYAGTAKVDIGDHVAKGETLISSEVFDTNGELLDTVRARGRVYGKVAFSITHLICQTEVYLHHSGQQKVFTALNLFGLELGRVGCVSVEGWESVETRAKFLFLPIGVRQVTYTQVLVRQRQIDIEQRIGQLKTQAVLDNVIKAGGSEISTITTTQPTAGGLLMLNIHITAEMLIAAD
ncbi:MAG: sporulation protein YqfD [Firmicutes bacterium]|nr:sporulation protein YqfD [Bacillota bacterium]